MKSFNLNEETPKQCSTLSQLQICYLDMIFWPQHKNMHDHWPPYKTQHYQKIGHIEKGKIEETMHRKRRVLYHMYYCICKIYWVIQEIENSQADLNIVWEPGIWFLGSFDGTSFVKPFFMIFVDLNSMISLKSCWI